MSIQDCARCGLGSVLQVEIPNMALPGTMEERLALRPYQGSVTPSFLASAWAKRFAAVFLRGRLSH